MPRTKRPTYEWPAPERATPERAAPVSAARNLRRFGREPVHLVRPGTVAFALLLTASMSIAIWSAWTAFRLGYDLRAGSPGRSVTELLALPHIVAAGVVALGASLAMTERAAVARRARIVAYSTAFVWTAVLSIGCAFVLLMQLSGVWFFTALPGGGAGAPVVGPLVALAGALITGALTAWLLTRLLRARAGDVVR